MNTPLNQPYTGVIIDFKLIESVPLKLYFADIKGRDPSIYEWAHSGLDKDKLISILSESAIIRGLKGSHVLERYKNIPQIGIAFPHVTATYRFGSPHRAEERETNLYKQASAYTSEVLEGILYPADAEILGCPLELNPILSEEMRFWATENTVEEYLNRNIPKGSSIHINNPNKLRDYLEK